MAVFLMTIFWKKSFLGGKSSNHRVPSRKSHPAIESTKHFWDNSPWSLTVPWKVYPKGNSFKRKNIMFQHLLLFNFGGLSKKKLVSPGISFCFQGLKKNRRYPLPSIFSGWFWFQNNWRKSSILLPGLAAWWGTQIRPTWSWAKKNPRKTKMTGWKKRTIWVGCISYQKCWFSHCHINFVECKDSTFWRVFLSYGWILLPEWCFFLVR